MSIIGELKNSYGNHFQDLFTKLMKQKYGNRYQATATNGKTGDLKVDGVLDFKIAYAVYAPEVFTEDKLLKKLDSDFNGFMEIRKNGKYWQQITNYVFIIKNTREGITPKIFDLITNFNQNFSVKILTMSDLEQLYNGYLPFSEDGTLLNDDSEVSLETIQAIKQLKEKGIEFAIATGRSFNSANKIRKKIGLEIYLICNNGANIYNKNGELIKNNVMPADLIRKVVRFLTENKIGYFGFDGSGANFYVPYGTEIDDEFLKEHTPHYIKSSEDIDKLPALEKILIIEEDSERIYEIKDLIHDNFDDELEIVISADDCLDLNIKGCSKRGGVEYISQELEINPKEIMAFGDSGNDYKMLKYVGHPVAMKDSFMSKRDFENKTDFTNDESGVAKYLQQYFNL